MLIMENAEEVMQILERFTRLKQKEIPKELDDYLHYVAKTGDTIFKWTSLKYLFREKLLNVIKHFHDTTPRVDEIPQYPNVDPFNYENMKSSLLERLELFNAAPFTIQRLCELLIDPRKQYSRIDKFMRALEKNILVSTIEPGRKRSESENGDSMDSVVNGDLSLDVNVDIDMENEPLFSIEAQNGNGTASASEQASTNKSPADSESKDKVGSEPLKVDHTNDDEALPNPKKAKLDLDDEKKECEKADSEEKEQEEKLHVEESKKIETKSTEEASATSPESSSIKDPSVSPDSSVAVSSRKTDEVDDPKQEMEKVAVSVEKEIVKEDKLEVKSDEIEAKVAQESEVHAEKETLNKCQSETKQNNLEKPEDQSQSVSDTGVKTDSEKAEPCDSKSEVEIPKEVSPNAESEVSNSKADTTTVIAPLEETIGDKPMQKEELKEKGSSSTDEVAKKPEHEQSDGEPKDTDTVKEKPIEISEQVKEVANESLQNVDTVGEIAPDNSEVSASKVSDIPEQKEKTEAVKTDDAAKAVEVDDIITSTSSPEKTENPAMGDTAKPNTDASLSSEVESSVAKNELIATVPVDIEVPIDANIGVADIEPSINSTSAAVEAAVAVESTSPPVLALNDQPMEDLPLEEAVATIEEVVMSENGGATEMATDAIEPSKEEPTGMDVDDTSQEAMDQ